MEIINDLESLLEARIKILEEKMDLLENNEKIRYEKMAEERRKEGVKGGSFRKTSNCPQKDSE